MIITILVAILISHLLATLFLLKHLAEQYAKQHRDIKEYVDKKYEGLSASLSITDTKIEYDEKKIKDILYGIQNVTIKALQEEVDILKAKVYDNNFKKCE